MINMDNAQLFQLCPTLLFVTLMQGILTISQGHTVSQTFQLSCSGLNYAFPTPFNGEHLLPIQTKRRTMFLDC